MSHKAFQLAVLAWHLRSIEAEREPAHQPHPCADKP